MMRYYKLKSNNSAPSFLIFRNLSLDPNPPTNTRYLVVIQIT